METEGYIPYKRRREPGRPKKLVYILRGVPGTGKTTLAEKLEKSYKDIGWHVSILNRDNERERLLKTTRFKDTFGKELNYQESFSNVTANTMVRDEYNDLLRLRVQSVRYSIRKKHLLIIDSTHTKIADLVYTLRVLNETLQQTSEYDYRVYIITKRTIHGNEHNVPEPVMKNFKKELRESDEWLKKKFPKQTVNLL